VGWRRTPRRLILRRVRVADERRVVTAGNRAVQRGANTCVGLSAGDDEASDLEVGEDDLEVRVLERVAVALLDDGLVSGRCELADDLPVVASGLELLARVPNPHDGNALLPCLVDETADIRHDRVA